MTRSVTIVGARPQFIKLAPLSRAIAELNDASGSEVLEDIIVHTGQHYDKSMSDIFFEELEIPRPDIDLHIGSGSHAFQTGRMLEEIERVLVDREPDVVIVYGDTNSTLAGALAAAKLNIPIAHIEAGLRSFNREMPEEVNRIVTDHVSELLFAPTDTAMTNLQNEGLLDRAIKCGDVMLDAIRYNQQIAGRNEGILSQLPGVDGDFGVVTLHRASNTDLSSLRSILDSLNGIADEVMPLVFPAHPRTVAMIDQFEDRWQPSDRLNVIEPVGYLDMLRLLSRAKLVLTDSGGLQKEAFFMEVPCVTLREETEWLETVQSGGNTLVGTDSERLMTAVEEIMQNDATRPIESVESYFGDGHASRMIVESILHTLN